MRGPAHFTQAQSLVQLAHGFSYGDNSGSVESHTAATALAIEGLTHAVLALTAATIAAAPKGVDEDVADEWEAVLNPQPASHSEDYEPGGD